MVSSRLRHAIDLAAVYWAGEAEVVRSYFRSPARTRESDRLWLARQAFKEIWGSGFTAQNTSLIQGWAKQLTDWFPQIDQGIDRHEALELAEGLWAEFAHYCAFADAHDAMGRPGEPKLSPMAIRTINWPAEDALSELRRAHRRDHGETGWRATRFTEGGYCTLFAEGMALGQDPDGHDGRNGLIAKACARVYDDEFGHMLMGVVAMDNERMDDAEWALFERLAVEQLKLRIRMRNEQFGAPLAEARIQEIYAGKIEPIAFDYARARLAA
ncbi:MAG TPA: hypothetical protein VMV26_10220 [Alphaproteobacteria bacterium]|nr:hypothetical protein [Alphaproteobacteria bacterium]